MDIALDDSVASLMFTRSVVLATLVFSQAPQLTGAPAEGHAVQQVSESTGAPYTEKLAAFLSFRDGVKDLHPFLGVPHPVAIPEGDSLLVFEFDSGSGRYALSKKTRNFLGAVKNLRAAFPLDVLDNGCACVVSSDALDSQDGFATLMHEMVHCGQWASGEPRLKQGLSIVRKGNLGASWELMYPFPYERADVRELYQKFYETLGGADVAAVEGARSQLAQALSPGDFEYLVWEEWKEGFARYLENEVRGRAGLPEIRSPIGKSFGRRAFYEVGSRFIAFLVKNAPELRTNPDLMFEKIRSVGTKPVGAAR